MRRAQFRQVTGDEDVHAVRLEQRGAQRGERGDGGGGALGRAELCLEIREEGLLAKGVTWRYDVHTCMHTTYTRLRASRGHMCLRSVQELAGGVQHR